MPADPDVIARLRRTIEAPSDRAGRSADEVTAGRGTAAESPPALGGDAAKAFAFLVRSTAQRPLTCAEAAAKLRQRDHDDDVVAEAVAHAVQQGLLDDAAFARAWVQDRGVVRGYGRDRLVRELRRRKVDEDAMSAALALLEEVDEVSQATDLARRRAQRMPATLPPERVAQRLVGILVRRGHPPDLATRVARSVTALDRQWD